MEKERYCVLLVDDEPDVLEFLSYNLLKEGYCVLKAKNGIEALKVLEKERPHLIILDVMMPGLDGIEVCKRIRTMPEFTDTVVVFLTARGEEYSQIAGFESGADDYITKPIKPQIFITRVKAWLRRYKADSAQEGVNVLNDITINKEKYLVTKNGIDISLPRKEFELLNLLASKPNKVFTREEIYTKVWGNDVVVGDRTIDVHVRRIREKIGLDNIKTIKGVGYKYEE
jgi:two-component system alkaline phosphatase synthesis response regulator PhoP